MLPTSFVSCYCSRKHLKNRESQVLDLTIRGRSNAEIGAVLGIKEQVVKNYLKGVYEKTGVKNRVALIADVYDTYLAENEIGIKCKPQFEQFLTVKSEFEEWVRESKNYQRFVRLQPKFDSWLSRNIQLKQQMGLA
jgi:DNA-binding CsgD family transcriptional regulator